MSDPSPHEVHIEWGVRRPDGVVVAMLSEDIARGFATSSDRFTLVSRAVAHMPWTDDIDAALVDVDRLTAVVGAGPGQCGDHSSFPTRTDPRYHCTRPAGHWPDTCHENGLGNGWNWTNGDERRSNRWDAR